MRAMAGVVVALVLVCLLGLGGVATAQTVPPSALLLTGDEVGRIAGGDWTSNCGYLGLVESPSIACTIIRNDAGDGISSLSVQVDPMRPGMSVAEARQAWRPLVDAQVAAGVQTLHVVQNLGDEAYLITGSGAYADIAMLLFFAGGSSGMIQASTNVAVQGTGSAEPNSAIPDQLVQLGQVALARFEAQLGTVLTVATPVPGPSASRLTAVPTPTAAPTPAAVVTPTPVEPPADQLLTAADVRQVVGGDWSGDCARSQHSVACQFAQTGALARIGLSVDQPGPGTSVAIQTLDAWRQSVRDAAASTSATMTAVPDLGDEAYALTGIGAYSLEFYANGVTGRMDAADSDASIDATLPGLARIALSRLAGTTAAPSPAPAPPVAVPPAPPASGAGASMVAPGPSDISLDPVIIATSAAAAAGIVLLIPFPSALFNSTVEENYDEIRGWFRFRRRRARPGGDAAVGEAEAEASSTDRTSSTMDRFWATRVGIASFFVIAGILYGFLDPTFGFTLDSGLLFAGILIALVVSSAIAVAVVRRARVHLNGEGGRFRVLPGTLVVAVVCVLVTRITDFQPGYLYGVLAGLVFLAVMPELTTGREQAIKASAVAGAGVIAFLILGLVRSLEGSAGATGLWRPIDIALSALVVGGFEGLLFGMLPLTGLPGAQVKAWNVRIWALLLFLGAVGFLHIVVNPSSGYLVDSSRVPLVKVLALLVVFGGVSVGLWAWFRYRPMDRLRARPTGPVTSDTASPVAPAEGDEQPGG